MMLRISGQLTYRNSVLEHGPQGPRVYPLIDAHSLASSHNLLILRLAFISSYSMLARFSPLIRA